MLVCIRTVSKNISCFVAHCCFLLLSYFCIIYFKYIDVFFFFVNKFKKDFFKYKYAITAVKYQGYAAVMEEMADYHTYQVAR